MNVQFEELEGNDKLAYDFSQQSCKNVNECTNIGDYECDPSLSNVDSAVYGTTRKTRKHKLATGAVRVHTTG